MSQPVTSPSPANSPNPQTPASDTPTPDPERDAMRDEFRGLVKEAVLEVITERESAPPKGKTQKIDVLHMLFGPPKSA